MQARSPLGRLGWISDYIVYSYVPQPTKSDISMGLLCSKDTVTDPTSDAPAHSPSTRSLKRIIFKDNFLGTWN